MCLLRQQKLSIKKVDTAHKIACHTISQLKEVKKASVCKTGIYDAALFPCEQDQGVQLIGEKSRVACKMNDAATEVWLNTGAHVSLL